MALEEVLALRFASYDQYRSGRTIQQWIDKEVRDQLFSYGLSPDMNPDCGGKAVCAFAVVIIGERRVLFAEARLDREGRSDGGGGVRGEHQWTVHGIEEAGGITEE